MRSGLLSMMSLALAALVLCAGQTCVQSVPPVTVVDSVIPAGTYVGTLETSYKITSTTQPEGADPVTGTVLATHTFGSNGLPLTSTGVPLSVGYQVSSASGETNVDRVVASMIALDDGLVIKYDVVMTGPVPVSGQIVLVGTTEEGYTLLSDGTLLYASTTSVQGEGPGGLTYAMLIEGDGALAP